MCNAVSRDLGRTLGDLIGKLDVLRVECLKCGHASQYDVARLVKELGRDVTVGEWLSMSTAECQRRNRNGGGGSCAGIIPDLIWLP